MKKRLDYYDLHFTLGGYDFRVSNIVMEQFEKAIPAHSHSRNSYEIHCIPYGLGKAVINGQNYEVTPGALFVTGPYVEHSQVPDKQQPMCEYCIYLKVAKNASYKCSVSERKLTSLFLETNFWFGRDSQEIHAIMKRLFDEIENRRTGYDLQAENLLRELIVKLVRSYENESENSSDIRPVNLAENQYLIIEESFLYEYKSLSLEQLSGRLGLGIRQTERLLKTHYGRTFLQKRTQARMSAAIIMLRDPSTSIAQIAEETGYSCPEHFSAAFKTYYGKSASSYRKLILN